MKKILLALAFLMVFSTISFAQSSFGVYAKYQDNEDVEEGYGIGLQFLHPVTDVFSVCARAGYLFNYDTSEVDDGSIISLEVGARAYVPADGQIHPYLEAGLGGYYTDFDGVAGDLDVDDDFGYYLLLGSDFEANGTTFFGEAKYLWLEPDFDWEPFGSGEADLSGFGINIGVRF